MISLRLPTRLFLTAGRACIGAVLCLLPPLIARAQSDIPVGTWRAHISYSSINHVAVTAKTVYGAAANGIVVIDNTDGNSLSTLTKLNGLSSAGITALGAEPVSGRLLVAYDDGTFDLIAGKTVSHFNPFQNTSLAGDRTIHTISINGTLAYLATDYGVLLFDLNRAAIQETWRDLGESGQTLAIYQSVFLGDSVFLATDKGVLAGNLGNNLLDYRFWKRYNSGDLNGPVQAIATFQGSLYATLNGKGLYRYTGGTWIKLTEFANAAFTALSASPTTLYVIADKVLWRMDNAGQFTKIREVAIVAPQAIAEDANGKHWIGDATQGLVSNRLGAYAAYRPNSPNGLATGQLKYATGNMYLLGGGYSATFTALGEPGNINVFNGVWQTVQATVPDLTDIDFSGGKAYVSSFGYGLEVQTNAGPIVYTENNSTLVNLNPSGKAINVTGVETSADGVWVLNYGAAQSLHLLKADNSWQAFSFPITAARYPTDVVADPWGYVWMPLDPARGGGLLAFNREENKYYYRTTTIGAGALPNIAVRSIAVDREGLVWAGTDQGIVYFLDPTDDAIQPVYENRFLLRDDKVTAIAVDGGNRKWIGTERGVWLFSATGEALVYNFTTANSPLLSDKIRGIAIHGQTGEVFFSTDKGVVSFRGDATESTGSFSDIKIFPNPVTARFTGLVGITGLATDAFVKITDVSGALVWQTQAHGGSTSWDVRDYRGRRAATGVYLVFAATPEGGEHVVGKIAVID